MAVQTLLRLPADHPVWELIRLTILCTFGAVVMLIVFLFNANTFDWTEWRDTFEWLAGMVVALVARFVWQLKTRPEADDAKASSIFDPDDEWLDGSRGLIDSDSRRRHGRH